jgi:hypothetical protein
MGWSQSMSRNGSAVVLADAAISCSERAEVRGRSTEEGVARAVVLMPDSVTVTVFTVNIF